MEKSPLYATMDKNWRAACRVLLKTEVGALSDFEPFLSHYANSLKASKSTLSGKEVYYSSPYRPEGKFLLLSEQAKLRKAKVDIDDIKDMDSLSRASEEIAYYCGSKAFGNSQRNEVFDNIFDSSFIYRSHDIMKGEYIALSDLVINSKYLFGCSSVGDSTFCIGTSEHSNLTRAFECGMAYHSSDLYYCYYLKNCQNCMFSFNQVSKKFLIGNNQFTSEKYEALRFSLVQQMEEELQKKKSLPHLIQ